MINKSKRCPVIAITGNIGSGKSTVARIFEKKGALIIDADTIAKEILWNNELVHQQVINIYGDDICEDNGRISKDRLIAKAFQNRNTIKHLNAIVHPHMIKQIQNSIEEKAYSGEHPMIVVDAALIFEAGVEKEFDYVITVAADDDHRIDRIVARDGVKPEDVLQRMNVQTPQEKLIRKSDYVIHNNSSLSDLKDQSLYVFENIVHAGCVHQ